MPVDWRIGHVVKRCYALRGRTVTFSVKLRATQVTAFDLVSIDWKEVSVQRVVDPRASVLEVWIRLIFDKGTIRPAGGSLYVSSKGLPGP